MPKLDVKTLEKHGKKGVKKVTGFISDFKDFINRGNVVDLAIGVMIGTAFTAIVNSVVGDIVGPIIGILSPHGNLDEMFIILRYNATEGDKKVDYPTIQQARQAGAVTLNHGKFIQTIINFFITAFCLFVIIKIISLIRHKDDAISTDWPCPKCKEKVKEGAIRCPHCCAEPIRPEILDEEPVNV